MALRLIVSGVLACGLLAAEATAGAATADARIFKGKTAQRYPIKMNVKGRTVDVLRFKIKLRCRDGGTLILTEMGFLPTRLRGGGKFRDVQLGMTDKVLIRGRVGRKAVRGKVRVFDKLGKKKIRCRSPWVRFSAQAR